MNDIDNWTVPEEAPDPPRTNRGGSAHTARTDPDAGLPAAIDCERTILGAILLDNAAHSEAAEKISAEDFSLDSHQRIYAHMTELMDAQRAVDIVTLSNELLRFKELDAVGGVAYLASLTEGLPRRPVIDEYIKIVKDKSLLRRLMSIAEATSSRAADQSEAALNLAIEVGAQLDKVIYQYVPSTFERVGDYLRTAFPTAQAMVQKTAKQTGIESGFRDFDRMTCGMQRGELIIVAARPSIGKTALMWNIAEHVGITCESIVGIKSLEMSKESLLRRGICSRGRVPLQSNRNGDMTSHQRMMDDFEEAYNDIKRAPIFIDDQPSGAKGIVTQARSMKKKHGLDLLMIDYLGLFQHQDTKFSNKTAEVGLDCLVMKNLAKELDIPVVVLCQLSRELTKRTDKRPILSDLRDSGNIEEHADIASFIHREGYYEPKEEKLRNKGEWIIAKNRNGPTGTVELRWDPEYTRFSDPFDERDLNNTQEIIDWNAIRGGSR